MYRKDSKKIANEPYRTPTDKLIRKSEVLENDEDWLPEQKPTRSKGRKRRREVEYDDDDDIAFSVGPTYGSGSDSGPSSGLRSQIEESGQSDSIKAHCKQLLQQYEDDPENNSTALTALQLILQLPTNTVPPPVTMENTHNEITQFLDGAWQHMENEVYGHSHAKSEVIEYLVSRLFTTGSTRIIGLVGDPGVGKTTLAVNGIAHAMGVPFYHISIGGLRDVTYFNGTFRCWKGAHQGVFTDILIRKKCLNPVIYIDELDKVATDTATDIYGLLTHATDPLTNGHIKDHFLGMDIDLSQATFIFSYNDGSVIPDPLRDRIKEIHLAGFDETDKAHIAKEFIIPSCLKEYNMTMQDIVFSDAVVSYVNKTLANVAKKGDGTGVRYLNKGYQSLIDKIMVNVVGHEESYNQLRGSKSSGGKRKRRKVTSTVRFIPYFKPVKLPYKLKIDDVDFYLSHSRA